MPSADRGRLAAVLLSISLFVVTLAVYVRHLSPSILPGDPAELATAAKVLGIPHPHGYPVYTWLAHLFTYLPWGDVAYRVNLMSAVFAAAAVALLFLTVLGALASLGSLSRPRAVVLSLASALCLAFTRQFWLHAEIAEVYSFSTFFVPLLLLLLLSWNASRRRRLLHVFSFLYGLSLGAHASNILFAPAFLVFLLLADRNLPRNRRLVLTSASLFVLGVSQFLYVYFRALQNPPINHGEIHSLAGWWNHVTNQENRAHLFAYPVWEIPSRVVMALGLLGANFRLFGLLSGLAGMIYMARVNRKLFAVSFLMFFASTFFHLQHEAPDVRVMFVPSYAVFALFVAHGWAWGLQAVTRHGVGTGRRRRVAAAVFVVCLLGFVTHLFVKNVRTVDLRRSLDHRAYFATVLRMAPPGALILSPFPELMGLKYVQVVEGVNPEAELRFWGPEMANETIDAEARTRPVFMTNPGARAMRELDLSEITIGELGRIYRVAEE